MNLSVASEKMSPHYFVKCCIRSSINVSFSKTVDDFENSWFLYYVGT